MPGPTDTIVLIHGLWMTPRSWEHWIARYASRGYKVLAPAWPGLEVEVEELRRDPTPLTKLDLKQVVDHYDGIISGLPTPPIVMGHSLGGTMVQILLDRGLGAAAVGLSPGTVKGVLDLPISTLRASMHILRNPFNRGKATPSSEQQFRYAFGNTMTEADSRAAYERYYVPAANRVLFDVAFQNVSRKKTSKVDFGRDARAPMLFIGAENDHVVPPSAVRSNVKKYRNAKSINEYKEFPGRGHFLAGQTGWEEIADYALEWVEAHTTTPTAPVAASSEGLVPATDVR